MLSAVLATIADHELFARGRPRYRRRLRRSRFDGAAARAVGAARAAGPARWRWPASITACAPEPPPSCELVREPGRGARAAVLGRCRSTSRRSGGGAAAPRLQDAARACACGRWPSWPSAHGARRGWRWGTRRTIRPRPSSIGSSAAPASVGLRGIPYRRRRLRAPAAGRLAGRRSCATSGGAAFRSSRTPPTPIAASRGPASGIASCPRWPRRTRGSARRWCARRPPRGAGGGPRGRRRHDASLSRRARRAVARLRPRAARPRRRRGPPPRGGHLTAAIRVHDRGNGGAVAPDGTEAGAPMSSIAPGPTSGRTRAPSRCASWRSAPVRRRLRRRASSTPIGWPGRSSCGRAGRGTACGRAAAVVAASFRDLMIDAKIARGRCVTRCRSSPRRTTSCCSCRGYVQPKQGARARPRDGESLSPSRARCLHFRCDSRAGS